MSGTRHYTGPGEPAAGDCVRSFEGGPWGDSIVTGICDGRVHLARPMAYACELATLTGRHSQPSLTWEAYTVEAGRFARDFLVYQHGDGRPVRNIAGIYRGEG